MDLVVFENNKPFVIDEFREGRFDYVELASDVAETKFFQFLFGQQIVDRLAAHYPSPRDRHHVPLWMYLSSQLSLRLHGQHSFHSYPLIIRSGGLIEALGPDVARREVDPVSGDVTLDCPGFNDRNLYPRKTPCDQDFLRKLARDTKPEELEDWYNRHVAAMYQELGAFDAEGLFMADGTYLFVPDNPRYEGSQKLLFDEHNHPVSKKQEQAMTKAQRTRCRWRRHYKAVLLLHCDAAGERFVVVGVRVLREEESEATALWPLIDTFLATVGAGVMKTLLLDRGFINGPQIGRLKQEHGIDTVIPIRSDMNLQEDVRGLMKLPTTWEEYEPTHRAPLPDATAASHGQPPHPTAKKRESTRQKTLARQRAEHGEPAPEPSRVRERTLIARFPGLTSWCAAHRRVLARRLRRRARGDLAAGDHACGLVGPSCTRSVRPSHRHRRTASPGEVLLGSDAIPLDGLEPGGQPDGIRLPDLQPAADSLAQAGSSGAESSHLANQPPPAARRRPGDHLPSAMLRVLHVAGAHGNDVEPGREGPPPCVIESPTPAARSRRQPRRPRPDPRAPRPAAALRLNCSRPTLLLAIGFRVESNKRVSMDSRLAYEETGLCGGLKRQEPGSWAPPLRVWRRRLRPRSRSSPRRSM